MTQLAWDSALPAAGERLLRAHAAALIELGERFGVRDLRLASPGRLVGRIDVDRDAMDVSGFELAARELLAADVGLFSDRVLTKPNVSPIWSPPDPCDPAGAACAAGARCSTR